MSRSDDEHRTAGIRREVSLGARLKRLVPRLASVREDLDPPPTRQILPPRDFDADLRSLRGALERLDDRLSHEMSEREGKLLEELRRGMLQLETELSERFAASVVETRRALRRMFAAFAVGVACLAALVVVVLAYA